MQRILIFGAAGSGTTTLAHCISEALIIPYIDSDEYYCVSKKDLGMELNQSARKAQYF